MRFLCLHGLGTNSQIFESQTAAMRFELGDQHTFEFAEGNIPVEMAPEFQGVASSADGFFGYANPEELQSYVVALKHLDSYVQQEGPFDGIVAFSQGATIAATYLAQASRKDLTETAFPNSIKCAILFSAGGIYDTVRLQSGEVSIMTPEANGDVIHIPTMHIWGSKDSVARGLETSDVCAKNTREIYIHAGGHEIPGTRMEDDVKACVKLMRRVIAMATDI